MKSNRNAILTGYIDAFCLICEIPLTGDDEVENHMSLQSHIKNLESTQLVQKFKDDQILKVKKGYYCMLCNLIFTTLTKVGLHVVEKEHKTSKGSHLLNRAGSLISFGDVVIDEKAWHGLVDDMCAVCNAEFDDEAEHLADTMHAMNLVKNEVEFDEGHIHRKIDNTTFQCITCNTVLPLCNLATHFENSEHKSLLLKRKNDFNFENGHGKPVSQDNNNNDNPKLVKMLDISITSSSSNEGFNSAEGSDDDDEFQIIEIPSYKNYYFASKEPNKSTILDSVTVFEKNEVNINFESETALCKKCLKNIKFEFKSIENHIEEHKRNPKKRDVGYVPFPCEADMRTHESKSNAKKFELPAIAAASNGHAEARDALAKDHNETASKPTNAKNKDDNETLNESPADFAKRNQLNYNSGNNNAYCRLCLVRVPASLRCMKEHVAGNAHKNKLSKNQSRSYPFLSNLPSTSTSSTSTSSTSTVFTSTHKIKIRKMPMEDYLDEVLSLESILFGSQKVVNEKFCIKAMSFHMISVNGDRMRCQVCELLINRWEMTTHIESYIHKIPFNKVPVIWSFDTEFVREVRPGIFHCGFCNMMEASLEALETHFKCGEHKENKNASAMWLARHQPAIAEYKKQQVMAHLLEAMMLGQRPLLRRF